ncbi:MAG TPA: redoxin domain-containing protein [Pyrinomonadaceae bacterium]|nr:redoxin domain-containing protein [Pyrinomonadaceae bacterium]
MKSAAKSATRPRPATPVLLLCFAAALAAGPARAQGAGPVCEAPPAVKRALESLPEDDSKLISAARREKRLEALRPLLQQFPDDLFVHRRFQEAAQGASAAERSALAEQYRALSAKRPDDPLYLYLHGRLLVGRNTPEARALMERALARDPDFAWAHLSLADIYNLPRYRDKAKAQEAVKAFFRICPAPLSPEAYRHLRGSGDTALIREGARALRARLESSRDPAELAFYNTLWQLEFSARPVAEHTQVREQAKADLERLRGMNLTDSRRWFETLRAGYRVTNDKEARRRAEDEIISRFPHSLSAKSLIMERWQEENPQPDWGGPRENMLAYNAKLLPATEEWIRRWPDDPMLRFRRFDALLSLDTAALPEVEAAFDALQKSSEKDPGTFLSIPPAPVRMAQLYLKRGVRLERVPELVRRGFSEFEAVAAEEKDSDAAAPGEKNYTQENLKSVYWSGWPVLAEAYLKTKQPARAREVLAQMEAQLAKEKPGDKAEAGDKSLHQWREATFLEWAGRVAEAEGRRLDALAFYQAALTTRPAGGSSQSKQEADALAARARKLWLALGGTEAAWAKWSGRGAPRDVSVAAGGAWEERGKPLPDFELTDLGGRTWRLADLKGKVAFINVWATWCGPCQQELPYVERLHERLKGRQDVAVLTFNIDQEVGLVEPYVKEKGLTVPVLPARPYVEGLLPSIAIPRSWIVGPDGTMLMEQVGFGREGDEWLRKALELIDKAGAAK